MIQNDAKGSYGAFSTMGKITAEVFINIKKKDKIINPKRNNGNNQIIINFLKRNNYDNIEGDIKKEDLKDNNDKNLDESEVEEPEEESDIFEINEEEEKKKKEMEKNKNKKKRGDSFTCYHRTNEDAYKFHDLHMHKKKYKSTYSTPTCTKYYPNKNLVWKRTTTGPKWETMVSRKPLGKKIFDGSYLCHEDPLKNITNCFINMDKQTIRGDITNTHNLRVNTAKRFVPKDNKNVSTRRFNRTVNDSITTDDMNINMKKTKSGKDINKKINLEINNKWKNKLYYNETNTPLQTISNIEEQKINDLTDEKSTKSNRNIKALTTELTETTPNNQKTLNTNLNQSNTSSKIEFEEKKTMDMGMGKEKTGNDNENIKDNESDSDISSLSNDSYHKYKNHYTKQIKPPQKTINQAQNQNFPKLSKASSRRSSINVNNNFSTSVKSKSKIINKNKKRPKTTRDDVRYMVHKKHIKGPEFDKIIPREYYDNLADNGISLIPFSINNYKQVRERPLTVVVYKRKPYFKRKVNHFKGMDIDQYLDAGGYKLKNKCYVPIFNKMKTRPMYDGNPLPVFMKGAVSRDACNITTDTSLKLNCFADGKFRGNYNTFLTKKSFNKIINLNLLNSNNLIDYLLVNRKEAFKNNDEIMRSLKFYKKNFKDFLKEGSISKFDNITYKTIKSKLDDYEVNEK